MTKTAVLKEPYKPSRILLSIFFAALCLVYAVPLIAVFYNAFKTKSGIVDNFFALPSADTFAGFSNFLTGIA